MILHQVRACSLDPKALDSDLVGAVSGPYQSTEVHCDYTAKQIRTNVIGVTNATNIFLPLLRAGTTRKIVAISSPAGDLEFVRGVGMSQNIQYSVSKAALNMIVAQFALALKPEGFTIIALCPGAVNTWSSDRESAGRRNPFQLLRN